MPCRTGVQYRANCLSIRTGVRFLFWFYFISFLGGGGGGAGQLADWYRVAGYINSMAKQSMAIKMMCLGSRRSTTSSGLLFLGKDLEAQ